MSNGSFPTKSPFWWEGAVSSGTGQRKAREPARVGRQKSRCGFMHRGEGGNGVILGVYGNVVWKWETTGKVRRDFQ